MKLPKTSKAKRGHQGIYHLAIGPFMSLFLTLCLSRKVLATVNLTYQLFFIVLWGFFVCIYIVLA